MTNLPSKSVRRALSIWLLKPHIANKRLFGSKILSGSVTSLCDFTDNQPGFLKRLLIPRNPNFSSVEEEVRFIPDRGVWNFRAVCTSQGYLAEYEVSDEGGVEDPVLVNLMSLEVSSSDNDWVFTTSWFSTEFIDRLNHWYNQAVSETSSPIVVPMNLIDVERYVTVQRHMKDVYGRSLISSWTEKTNAEKFVFEDIAIAAYLISLWSSSDQSKVHFVDLGCGNGLLVYLLNAEGYSGIGLDVRRRKIWDKYPSDTMKDRLLEVTLDPSDPTSCAQHIPPETTWLIGNHSDELTPWLPVLSSRISAQCNFFVLPCCPYDLFSKFSSYPSASKHQSRYSTYLEFIGELAEQCGFKTVVRDMMRIPSTRRTCWVGWASNATQEEERSDRLKAVEAVVEAGRKRASTSGVFLNSFKPRASVEPVRNCTQLPIQLRNHVCDIVFTELLARGEAKRQKLASGKFWNPGGSLKLSEITSILNSETLAAMKCQNGGLQTLLRNHHQAFEVRSGEVKIRREIRMQREQARRAGRLKTSICWMSHNHPDGCPRSAEDCLFKHKEDVEDS